MKQCFLYLFDYGDEYRFEIQLISTNPNPPKVKYPRLVESHGESPSQYGYIGVEEELQGDDGEDEE
jgi:hypothetical protein